MKLTFGVLAALLFVSTVAFAQFGGSPFPQAANPALQNATVENQGYSGDMPSSMAANEGVVTWHDHVELGTPFPEAANPSLGSGTNDEMAPSGNIEDGSPFPEAANPSRENR